MRHIIATDDFAGEHRMRLAAHHGSGVNKALEAVLVCGASGRAELHFEVLSHREVYALTSSLVEAVEAYNVADLPVSPSPTTEEEGGENGD